MWAVWRQDARRLGACLTACLVCFGVLWNDRGNHTWIPGLERGFLTRWAAVFGLSVGVGVLLGLRDRVEGTRESWIQRPVPARQLFASRALGSVLVVQLALLLVMVASWFGLLDDERARRELWSLGHAGAQVAWLTCLVPGVAGGLVLSTMGGPWFRSVLGASIGVAALFMASLGAAWWRILQGPADGHGNPLGYAGVQLAISLPLFALAASRQIRGLDPDHGRAEQKPVLGSAVVIAATVWVMHLGLSAYAHGLVQDIRWKQPVVTLMRGGGKEYLSSGGRHGVTPWMERAEPGESAPSAPPAWRPSLGPQPDKPRTLVATLRPVDAWNFAARPPHSLERVSRDTDLPLVPATSRSSLREGAALHRTIVKQLEGPGWEMIDWDADAHARRSPIRAGTAQRYPLMRNDGKPLSSRSILLSGSEVFVDPVDSTVWVLDPRVFQEERALAPLPLPMGHELLAWDARSGTTHDPNTTSPNAREQQWTGFQAKTSEGWFALVHPRGWVPASEVTHWFTEPFGMPPGPLGARQQFERIAPLYVRGRVVDDEGHLLLEHVFGPGGFAEDEEARVALAGVVCAPILDVLAHANVLRSKGATRYVERGHNGSIVWWSAAIGLLAALLTARRMRRLRVGRSVAWTWTLGALLGGVGVLAVQWAYVRPRAWGDVPPHGHTKRRILERASRLTSEAVS